MSAGCEPPCIVGGFTEELVICTPGPSCRAGASILAGSSHRGWTAAARLTAAYPNAIMTHTPVHASWLNQIEIYFSVVQRKILTPDDHASLEALADQLTAFEAATTRSPAHSTGDPTATTSTDSSTASPPNPRRISRRDH
ncbi:MAG TPA: hypothetical protein VF241_02355 [Propionibacteriaceae bacterium]